MHALLPLLLAVTLAPPFGEATATAISLEDGLRIEVTVSLEVPATAVVVRGRSAVEELPPVALSEVAPGEWAGVVDLPAPLDLPIAFEAIYPDGGSMLSDVHRLTELGVDRAVFGTAPVATTAAPGRRGDARWVWLAAATGLAALGLLIVWTVWEGRSRGDEGGEIEATGP